MAKNSLLDRKEKLVEQSNAYIGDNIFQELFYAEEGDGLVDIEKTADGEPGVVFLVDGDKLLWLEDLKTWTLL